MKLKHSNSWGVILTFLLLAKIGVKFALIGFAILAVIVVCIVVLFVINGMFLANNETPVSGKTSHATTETRDVLPGTKIKVMAYNIAKGFIHKGGINFEKREVVAQRLRRIADLINQEQPHLVFLSEAIFECGPWQENQVIFLAEATGMHIWTFGENYNFGLPFYRIVGGNAILSRWPLKAVDNPSLAGRQPFYVTKNNRRILWCELDLGGETVLLGSVHNDSFNLANNLVQTRQILDYIGDRPALLAGDFNARPHEAPIQLIRETGRFTGAFDGPLTFSAHKPEQKIDFILAPATWELLEHHVIQSNASDHLPIVSTFRISGEIVLR